MVAAGSGPPPPHFFVSAHPLREAPSAILRLSRHCRLLFYTPFLIRLRIFVSSLTLAAGLAVFALGLKSNKLLEDDRNRCLGAGSSIKLDLQALLNLTRTSSVMSASFIIITLFLIVFLARRWHHPSESKHDSFLQKIRTIVKLVMDGQFFAVCFVFSLMLTLASNANTRLEPALKNLPDPKLALRIPARYIENRYIMALVGTAWALTFGYLLGYVVVRPSHRGIIKQSDQNLISKLLFHFGLHNF
ncbi:hypothetical protein VP01_1754g2 [Puccinia sorghi]|uniref:Uncharacterized protein n=1 Tax=Puccinia sorghi TaxID=27349 RepID=A0A0L6VGX9_9BASI|nr:hypothetical protein VP01_1754g2 [Puccinia sorghi]